MTWIDVADSAIKIGLGALIGGFFAIIAAIVNHRQQVNLSHEERLRTTLEEISKELESTLSALFSQGIDDARYVEDKLGLGYDEGKWWKRIEKYEASVDDAIAAFNILDGRLRLFACDTSANLLASISDSLMELPNLISPLPKKEIRNTTMDAVIRDAFKKINDKKALFYKELNKEFATVHL